ncbi:MAG: MFS transporter [Hyphomicrobiaceae bacterium]|nr:MFS transporter [Hyphomicrobiaceae bacterium]
MADEGKSWWATRAGRLVVLVCAAQVLVQLGAFFWPALLPGLSSRWSLTNSEAGWITSAFYGAYMFSVPVLVTLTDRFDPKRIYLIGVGATVLGHASFALLASDFWSAFGARALAGFGWAGTYMTGLKLLADEVDAKMMSRATAGHAASIGFSGALSFLVADLIASAAGWSWAFGMAAATAAIAWLMVLLGVPAKSAPAAKPADGGGLFNFIPVLRNRSAMAYAIGYCVHTLEMNALRGWGVAFLGYVAASTGAAAGALSPTVVVTALGLVGTVASVMGNEAAIRVGRRHLIVLAMIASIVVGGSLGWLGTLSYWLAAGLIMLYGIVVWLDSSSLTAGAAGTADPSRRGATLAVHSMLGYAGGFVGPLLVGVILDASGGMSRAGWTAAFLAIAGLMGLALVAFVLMRPAELAGDRGPGAGPRPVSPGRRMTRQP